MKLYFRLLWTLITGLFARRIDPLDESVTSWTVLPTDIDLYGHMNNGRFPMIMDLARIDAVVRAGLARRILARRWITPVGSCELEFRAPLGLFSRYRVHTRLVYWDERWFYFRQEFRPARHPERIAAVGHVKAVFCARGARGQAPAVVPTAEVIAALGLDGQRPPLTDELRTRLGLAAPRVEASAREADAPATHEPVAIVGIGCRLPGGVEDARGLWQMLEAGTDCIVDIPSSRWDPKKFHDPGDGPGRAYVHRAGILSHDIHAFDAGFFGISPREADTLDPQQRMLLEVSWEAFEDAGIVATALAGSRTGVFVGGFTTDSLILRSSVHNRHDIGNHGAASSTLTMLSNRLSYFYDLRGPSFSLDTACSSSLVAVHQACASIWSGESEMALAGGVNLLLAPETQVTMAKGRFLSRRGRCSTFSSQADGYVRGEGAALVVLQPLSKALAAGHPIYAVIRGTAVNQDGRTAGITLPNGDAQMDAMRTAYRRADIDPSTIAYVEAHGTGTAAGDPIEARAIGTVVGAGRSADAPCLVGSIKTNVGHLEGAAGVTGLIKAALVLKHGRAVPHLHLDEVNPEIDLDALHLRVPTAGEALRRRKTPLRAAVNSFGYGGTNAHVVLEEAPRQALPAAVDEPAAVCERPVTLAVSARSPEALAALAGAHAARLAADPARVLAIGRSAALARSHHRHRAFFQAADAETLHQRLATFAADPAAGDGCELAAPVEHGRVCFVYTGMGPQWWGMGRELLAREPVYRDAVRECDELFRDIAGWSVIEELGRDEADSRVTRTEIAQPCNFVVQVGLTRLLGSWGIEPAAVLGHSIGEVGSIWASGALSLRDALTVAYHRSRLQQRTAGKGGMLAVGASLEECAAWTERFGDVAIAAHNGPSAITLAGAVPSLEAIAAELKADGRFQKFLRVEVPYHSPAMDEIEDELQASLAGIRPRAPMRPIYSTVTGARFGETVAGAVARHDAGYWWKNVRGSVYFADAIGAALADDHDVFVEIGPHPVLASSMRELSRAAGRSAETVATLVRKRPEQPALAAALGRLYALGVDPDWRAFYGDGPRVPVPRYPWNRRIHWQESPASRRYRLPHDGHPLVSWADDDGTWNVELNDHAVPFLRDHRVAGAVLFPAAGHIELAAALHRDGEDGGCSIEDLELLAPVAVADGDSGRLAVSIVDGRYRAVHLRGDGDRASCAAARVYACGTAPARIDRAAVSARVGEAVPAEVLYAELAARGLEYGPCFRAVTGLSRADGEVLAELALPEALDEAGYLVHPVLVDAALHSLIGAARGPDTLDLVPAAIERVVISGTAGRRAWVHGRVRSIDDDGIVGDIRIADDDGNVMVDISGLQCVFIERVREPLEQKLQRLRHRRAWRAIEPATAADETPWLVVTARPQLVGERSVTLVTPAEWAVDPAACLARAGDGPVRVADLRWLGLRDGGDPVAAGSAAASGLLGTLQALAASDDAGDAIGARVERYFVVTRGAEAVGDGEAPQLACAPLLGLARTAMSERPELRMTTVDIDPVPVDLADLLAVLAGAGAEQELAHRSGRLFGLRIERASEIAQDRGVEVVPDEPAAAAPAYELAVGEIGKLDSLGFVACARPAPGPGQIEVEVAYCSLHFKDVMKAMGLISRRVRANTFFGSGIGMEGTGIVSAVGPGVTDVAVGDRVYAPAPFLRSHVILDVAQAVRLPDAVGLDEGASILTFMTVYHALVKVAHLAEGERLLVHSAAGGIGLAAIEIARWRGAEVIATAGTDEKRAFLRRAGVERVADSRSVDFADDVMAWTDGKGVDVVLNFTPGAIMRKSLDCLAPFGRFIELGKTALDRDEGLPLRPFNENLTFSSIDFDRLLQSRPAYVKRLSDELFPLFAAGAIRLSPHRAFAAGEVDEAFRFMARGKHIGKVVVGLRDPALRLRAPAGERLLRADRTYLVTGGLGGFGLEVARWLAAHGARNLALVSRRGGAAAGADETIEAFDRQGVRAVALAADVSRREDVDRMLGAVRADLPPIAGVFHAAAVLDDRPLGELDEAAIARVMGPKAAGAWHLHQLTAGDPIEHMVFFSSISSVVGNAGQGNYVAANAFLDQLAHHRRARGLPALSVNWGVIGRVGLVARDGNVARHLERLGIHALLPEDALAALGACLRADEAQLGLMDVAWRAFADVVHEWSGAQRYADVLAAASADDEDSADGRLAALRATYGELDEEARLARVEAGLLAAVAGVMKVAEDSLDAAVPLRDLGLDSLMAMEIATAAEQAIGMEISAMDLASGPPPRDLARRIAERIERALEGEQAAPAVTEEAA